MSADQQSATLETTHVCKVLKATGNETRMYPATSRMRVEYLTSLHRVCPIWVISERRLSHHLLSALCPWHHAIRNSTADEDRTRMACDHHPTL
jgi:hypothetical protein